MKLNKYFLAFFIIIAAASVSFSQEKTITFTDNSTLEVTNEQKSTNDLSKQAVIKIENKEFVADFVSIGKAVPPLDENTLKKLSKKDRTLVSKIKSITSAYSISQGDTKFYFAAFNTVNYDEFRKCGAENPCKIIYQAVIITIEDKGKKENIVIIKSMQIKRC